MKLFTDHPRSVGESYGEHLMVAGSFGLRLIYAGFACLIHGLLPFLCLRTGSTMVRELHGEMITARETCNGRKPSGFSGLSHFDPVV